MEYKYIPGQRVRILDVPSLGGRKEWAGRELTLKRHDSDGWDEPGWSVEEPNCYYRFRESEMTLAGAGPIVTETVTVHRLEPGVYGPLHVGVQDNQGYPVLLSFAGKFTGKPISSGVGFNASELREMARVALEIAEYLDVLD